SGFKFIVPALGAVAEPVPAFHKAVAQRNDGVLPVTGRADEGAGAWWYWHRCAVSSIGLLETVPQVRDRSCRHRFEGISDELLRGALLWFCHHSRRAACSSRF